MHEIVHHHNWICYAFVVVGVVVFVVVVGMFLFLFFCFHISFISYYKSDQKPKGIETTNVRCIDDHSNVMYTFIHT